MTGIPLPGDSLMQRYTLSYFVPVQRPVMSRFKVTTRAQTALLHASRCTRERSKHAHHTFVLGPAGPPQNFQWANVILERL